MKLNEPVITRAESDDHGFVVGDSVGAVHERGHAEVTEEDDFQDFSERLLRLRMITRNDNVPTKGCKEGSGDWSGGKGEGLNEN